MTESERQEVKAKLIELGFWGADEPGDPTTDLHDADIHTVAALLGHKTLSMAQRYQHLSPALLADAVGKLDVVFDAAKGAISAKNGEERYRDVTAQLALTDGVDANS